MNLYFLIAGVISILLGFIHSILGEYLIIQHKQNKGTLVPAKANTEIKVRHLRIIWATWHLASLIGWCIGTVLIKIALTQDSLDSEFLSFTISSIIVTMFASSLLVFIGTKAKHPDWVVLLVIGMLLLVRSG